MVTPAGYIYINRRFSALHGSVETEDTAAASYLRGSFAGFTLGWDELLKERLVIILGEPGSGKSWEFRRRSALLSEAGKPAFLIELERLVSGVFATGYTPQDYARFQQWQRGREIAYIFLDSVDESKIRRSADFYTALDKVLGAIGPAAMDRVQVYISSRISEWQPETDLHEVLTRFGLAGRPGTTAIRNTLLVVQLEPLDRDRVRTFAASRGIANPELFLAELDNRYAWEFARRPLDVLDLAEFWRTSGCLGTLTEIIEHDVTIKLRETAQRHSHFLLSEERAKEGAEVLAVATVLCMRPQFKVPADTYKAPEALDAASCLPANWTPAEVAALLSRPLFDSATYGQIRFHHRRIAEYLAACWFRRRMEQGCPTHTLLQQLFQEVRGALVPRRSLIPIIAWLCAGTERWNDEVRARVVQWAPGIHLEYGDAERLPLEFKRRLLAAWIERNKDRDNVWDQYTPDALRRLAEPRLVPDVANYLGNGATKGKVRKFLVHLVRHGRLTECVPCLMEILRNPAESDDMKVNAMAALRDIGTPESHRQVWEILRAIPALPRLMCSVACEALYPNTIRADDLATLLEKPCREKENTRNLQHTLHRHLAEQLTAKHADPLLRELNRLIQLPPHIRMSAKETRISSRFDFLLNLLPLVLTRLLTGATPTEVQCGVAAESLSLLAESYPFHHRHIDDLDSLDGVTRAHPRVRRCFFWQTLERSRDPKGAAPSPYLLMHDFRSLIQPSESDAEWMIRDLETAENQGDRKLLLTIALKHTPRSLMAQLKQAAATDPELSAMVRENRTGHRQAWFHLLLHRWGSAAEWKNWWFMRRYSLSRRWEKICDRWRLFVYRGRLRRGIAIGELAQLCVEAARDGSKLAPANWQALANVRGAGVAEAAKAGAKQAWRRYTPPLPHEKSRPNEVSSGLIVGLAGIQSAIADGDLAFGSISDDDVRLLTRYAINEMNGFPDWFRGLAADRPGPVAEVLKLCVVGEWQYPADREHAHDVLADLAWEGQALARVVRPTVIEGLRVDDPAHPAIREAAITLAVKTTTLPDADLGQIAATRCRVLPPHTAAFQIWLAVCLQVDAGQAITILEECLPGSQTAEDIVLSICEMLEGDAHLHLSHIANPDYLNPAALERLIPLVYRYIRPAEDVDHGDGEPYSATTRDEAARFRDGLLTRLANNEAPAAMAALRRLSVVPELASSHDWIRHLIDERTVSEADHRPWNPTDVRVFAQEHESDPRIDAELYRIICNRLTDIKNDVERSDNSLREELPRKCEEYVLRRWLARKLKERANKRYTIPQEEEIDQEQRPDLRAENPNTDPVSIELKWADNWTLPDLLERLENQLIGQYLRAHNSRYGIYVLGMDGRKNHWKDPNGRRIEFDEVIQIIDRRAHELADTCGTVAGLCVVGIDFRVPSKMTVTPT